MSGNHGLRGYLVQTLISVLDSLEGQNHWTSVTVEPTHESEKVDIIWEYGGVSKVTQVKSTVNTFKYSDVEIWCHELEHGSPHSEDFELILVGHCQQKILNNPMIGKVKIPAPRPLNIDSLLSEASNKLDLYYERKGRNRVTAKLRGILVKNLISEMGLGAISGEVLPRVIFDTKLEDWISEIEKQVLLNPLMILSKPEIETNEKFEHHLTQQILQLIGWPKLSEKDFVKEFDQALGEEVEHKTNFRGTWLSHLKDKTRDSVLINARADYLYSMETAKQLKTDIESLNKIHEHKAIVELSNSYAGEAIWGGSK